MGYFGGEHEDTNDSAVSFSVMIVLSDIPEEPGWDPGRFHLLSLGLYFVLDPFAVIFFTGCLRHGGTAPLAPPEITTPVFSLSYGFHWIPSQQDPNG